MSHDPIIKSDFLTKEGFTAIPNRTMADNRLRPITAAVLHYMLHRAGIPGWVFRVSDICNHFDVGQQGVAVRRAIKELEELGYVTTTRTRNERGSFTGFEYTVRSVSPTAPEFGAKQPVRQAEKPVEQRPAKKKAEVNADHQILARIYNSNRGTLPEKQSRGEVIIIPVSISKLMDKLIEQQGSVERANTTVELATAYAAAEAKREPNGWVALSVPDRLRKTVSRTQKKRRRAVHIGCEKVPNCPHPC